MSVGYHGLSTRRSEHLPRRFMLVVRIEAFCIRRLLAAAVCEKWYSDSQHRHAARTTTAILLLASTTSTLCASYALHGPNNIPARNRRVTTRCSPRMDVPAAVSLGAECSGGAIGVGVAYPLDTLKTKLQARESGGSNQGSLAVAVDIVREEGMSGFYGGVSSTMAGQALIKGVVFFVYEWAKTLLGSGNIALILAACISGAVGSLVVTPVERVKCVMQASDADGTRRQPPAYRSCSAPMA